MDEFYMPGLSHFENQNGWSGSRGAFNYSIDPPADGVFTVTTWYGPFCRAYAEVDATADFPVSEAGRTAMIAWLLAQAEQMNAHPPKSPEDCRAYYLSL